MIYPVDIERPEYKGTPTQRRAMAHGTLSRYADGDATLYEAAVAVEAAQAANPGRAVDLNMRLLKLARENTLNAIRSSEVPTGVQTGMFGMIADVVEQIPVMDGVDRVTQYRSGGPDARHQTPEVHEYVGLVRAGDDSRASYRITLKPARADFPRPQDEDLEGIAHPTVGMSSTALKTGQLGAGVSLEQGTLTHGTAESLLVASTVRNEAPHDNFIARMHPETASVEMLDTLSAVVENIRPHASSI